MKLHRLGLLALLSTVFLFRSGMTQEFEDRKIVLTTCSYDLKFYLNYENKTLQCGCDITVRNPGPDPIDSIPLLLYRLLEVTSVSDENGAVLPYRQRVLSVEDWEQKQVNFIEIELDVPLKPEEARRIHLVYDGYILGYTETGMRYVKDHIDREFTILRMETFAYPIVGYPSEKANRSGLFQEFDYTVRMNVPAGLTAANGGMFVSRDDLGNRVIWTYKNIKPAWRIDLPVASYHILESGGNRIYYFPEDSAGAARAMKALNETSKLFTEWFGPLDEYRGFSILEVPEGYGGQADVTSILLPSDSFTDPERLYTFYHEISHLWNVTPSEVFDPRFVSEGLAMFLQHRVQEVLEGKPNAVREAVGRNVERFKRRCQDRKGCADIPMIDYGKEDMTDLSYNKGMVFFALLHEMIGMETFNRIIGEFYSRYHSTSSSSDAFLQLCQNASGRDLERFFQEWVYATESNRLLFEETSFEEMLKRYK